MPAMTKFFFRPLYRSQTAWSIITWWESRRLPYNLTVGATGLVSLAVVAFLNAIPPFPGHLGIPVGVIVAYGVLANLCFCLGPLLDVAVWRHWGPNYSAVGPALFRYGFAFSVGLTILPIPLAVLGWGIRVLGVIW